ncbi:MAG: phosphoribosylaminoimidazolesuccinocarboxamide synthase [Flavobacteriales bacterium]|nr:phosphoribosylaminoimidazolesuccinocarboxamide synthase [Flavobacteriales bacterium]
MSTLHQYHFSGQTHFYRGKVRDVHTMAGGRLVMVASDRISAFDVVLPKPIPHKGQVLNQLAAYMLDKVSDIVPVWLEATPDPSVAVGLLCEPVRIEMVIRGHLTGHAWRTYRDGGRVLCGVPLPEGMREHDAFDRAIITPSTKAEAGHDEDISREEILAQGLADPALYAEMEQVTRALFDRGRTMALDRGLILVDTKYEFGLHDGRLMLMDEVHTPDSSRYFFAEGYEQRQRDGELQPQLSKEFVREWLIDRDFMGRPGDVMPELDEAFTELVSSRYIELYERITGLDFVKPDASISLEDRIQQNVDRWLAVKA